MTIKNKEVLTTGDVARICHVAPRTVSKWFDTGKLRGYRIPGSRDRRIPMNQLLQFMRAHGMPTKAVEGSTIRVLIVDADPDVRAVAEGLGGTDRYEVRSAANDFEAGMLAGKFHPHVVLVNVVSPDIDADEILAHLRANPDLSATCVVAMAGALTRGQTDGLIRKGFDRTLSKPCTFSELLDLVEKATDLVS